MSMSDWAKREVEIFCSLDEKEEPDEDFHYGSECAKSALKAYLSLMEDGHSGYSFSITATILKRLLDSYPLTAITEEEDTWNEIAEDSKSVKYQSQRMYSLFKTIDKESGKISYSDVERVVCKDDRGTTFHSGLLARIVDDLYPIDLPYYPKGRYVATVFDFSSTADPNSFDTSWISDLELPTGEVVHVDKKIKETDSGWVGISDKEYSDRWMSYMRNKKKRVEEEKSNDHD